MTERKQPTQGYSRALKGLLASVLLTGLGMGIAHADDFEMQFKGKTMAKINIEHENKGGLQGFTSTITMERRGKSASLSSNTLFSADMKKTLSYKVINDVEGRGKYIASVKPQANGWQETMTWVRDSDDKVLEPATVENAEHTSSNQSLLHIMEMPLLCPKLLTADGTMQALMPSPSKRLKKSVFRTPLEKNVATITRSTLENGDIQYQVDAGPGNSATLLYDAELLFKQMQLGDGGPTIVPVSE